MKAMAETASNECNTSGAVLPYPYGICKKVGDFKKIKRIGEGTYGYVYLAKPINGIDSCCSDGKHDLVALKRIIMHNESQDGFPLTSLREIKTLRRCSRHVNIVKLLDVVIGSGRDAVFLLFEYCEHDLASLISSRSHRRSSNTRNGCDRYNTSKPLFKESEVKCLMRQLLSALEYIHENHVVHRDIKLSNLLYNSKGELKVADFGLARTLSSPCDHESNDLLTTKVVTLWYRAPELLLGCTQYSFSIDMWSTGCIFTELLTNNPLLPGETEMDQIKLIFGLLGSPSERIWHGVTDIAAVATGIINLSAAQLQYKYNTLIDHLKPFLSSPPGNVLHPSAEQCLDFANSLLAYDPDLRASARDSLRHSYFRTSPMPTNPDLMPTFPASHDENTRKEDKKRKMS